MLPRRGGMYLRLSQASADSMKLIDQRRTCERLAEAHDVDIIEDGIYDEDDGISAFGGVERPGWDRMLHDVEAGNRDLDRAALPPPPPVRRPRRVDAHRS